MGRQCKALVLLFLALLSAPVCAIDGYHLSVYFSSGSDIENPPPDWLDGKFIKFWIEKGQYAGTIGGLGLHPVHAYFKEPSTGDGLRMMNKPHNAYQGVKSLIISDVPPRFEFHAPDGSVSIIDESLHYSSETSFKIPIAAPTASSLKPFKTTAPLIYFPEHIVLHLCTYQSSSKYQQANLCLSDANALSPFHLQVNKGGTYVPQMMRRNAQSVSQGADPLRENDVYYINY